jgi:hypothetical protein
MDFLKKHYEKILLGVMLAGLIGVLVFMLFYIASDRAAIKTKSDSIINSRVKALTNLDLTMEDSAIGRLKSSYNLDFDTRNKLLNPMEWVKLPDGSMVPKESKTGPRMAVVTNVTPMYLIIALASATTNELGARYNITVQHQGAATPAKQRPASHFVSVGDKPNETFALTAVQGPPENPTGLVLKLVDTGEAVTIGKDKPYRRVEAYAADVFYPPANRSFHNVRKGGRPVTIDGLDYAVDEVSSDEVILEDPSNQKKTSLPFKP